MSVNTLNENSSANGPSGCFSALQPAQFNFKSQVYADRYGNNSVYLIAPVKFHVDGGFTIPYPPMNEVTINGTKKDFKFNPSLSKLPEVGLVAARTKQPELFFDKRKSNLVRYIAAQLLETCKTIFPGCDVDDVVSKFSGIVRADKTSGADPFTMYVRISPATVVREVVQRHPNQPDGTPTFPACKAGNVLSFTKNAHVDAGEVTIKGVFVRQGGASWKFIMELDDVIVDPHGDPDRASRAPPYAMAQTPCLLSCSQLYGDADLNDSDSGERADNDDPRKRACIGIGPNTSRLLEGNSFFEKDAGSIPHFD